MLIQMPIFGYAERYFLECKYNRMELFELQNEILAVIFLGSTDIRKDLQTKVNDEEIDLCLRKCFSKKWIQRERLSVKDKVPLYRYFNKKS